MSIDDPQKALEAQLEAEERAESPLRRFVPGLAQVLEVLPTELLPPGFSVPATFTKRFAKIASTFIGKERDERREALITELSAELHWVKGKLHEVTGQHADFMRNEFPGLVLDGLEKAEQTRTRGRIKRIGRIVANAAVSGPGRPADITEELSRIAMALDDSDVHVLAELARGQRNAFEKSLGSVPGELVNNYWRSGETATYETPASTRSQAGGGMLSGVAIRLNIPEGELHSRCAKLQAFGLLVQVDRNPTKNGPGTLPYAILTRGIEFIDAVRSLADSGGCA
jgi:hypothetical protein